MSGKENKKYEIGFLAKEEGFKEKLIKLLTDSGAEIFDNGGLSRIRLAYPIKKENSAFFGFIYFTSQPEMIQKIDSNLRLNSEVLRHIIIAEPIIQQPIQIAPSKMKRTVFAEKAEIKPEVKKVKPQPILSNEALEKKLEEILK